MLFISDRSLTKEPYCYCKLQDLMQIQQSAELLPRLQSISLKTEVTPSTPRYSSVMTKSTSVSCIDLCRKTAFANQSLHLSIFSVMDMNRFR